MVVIGNTTTREVTEKYPLIILRYAAPCVDSWCVWSCRCVRCLNQPSWGRLWRSWALARTATLLSFTQIHPLLKHWACLWKGECLPCQWWMSQVTTHMANFSVGLCNHFSVKPFLGTNFHCTHLWRSKLSHICFPSFFSQRKGCGHLLQIWCHCKLCLWYTT